MFQAASNITVDILDSITRILRYIAFLIGYSFARVRKMGEFASALVDSTIEGFTFGTTEV